MRTIETITIDLQDWNLNIATSATIRYDDGSHVLEYCETLEEFKNFFRNHKHDIVISRPRIKVILDLQNVDNKDAINLANELKGYVNKLESVKKEEKKEVTLWARIGVSVTIPKDEYVNILKKIYNPSTSEEKYDAEETLAAFFISKGEPDGESYMPCEINEELKDDLYF